MPSTIVQSGFLGNNNAVVYGGRTTSTSTVPTLPEPMENEDVFVAGGFPEPFNPETQAFPPFLPPFNFVLLGENPVTPPNSSPNPGGVPVAIPNNLPSKAGLPVIISDSTPVPGIL